MDPWEGLLPQKIPTSNAHVYVSVATCTRSQGLDNGAQMTNKQISASHAAIQGRPFSNSEANVCFELKKNTQFFFLFQAVRSLQHYGLF